MSADRPGSPEALADELYEALADGDRHALDELLHPDFEGHATEGLPLGLGGAYPDAPGMRRLFWGRIAEHFDAQARPSEHHLLDDGRLMVRGRYVGSARKGDGRLDAEFIHLLRFADGRIVGLDQLTDSARWTEALDARETAPGGPRTETAQLRALTTLQLEVTDGLGILTVDRPAARNGIDATMAAELLEVAVHCTRRTDLRALLIRGNGPAFTVGGDVSVFAALRPGTLPDVLRSMIASYHQALQLLTALELPVVAAVHGAVAGGGLGLMYSADIVVAADDTRFATGFGSLGLSGDGGNSWWLPRLVGPRRAAELYLEGRVLTASEAQDWGLVTRVVPADELRAHGLETARRLASGPTRAYGEIRQLLRHTWSNGLVEQHALETDTIARTAATSDAVAAIDSFVQRRPPTFEGR